jgi:hypothetical protein
MAVIDELNLEYGIVHQDIAARNPFVDPATDSILLFDFNIATGVGHQYPARSFGNYIPARNDVRGLIVLAYYMVTRDPRYKTYYLHGVDEADVANVEGPAKWAKLAVAVELDHDRVRFPQRGHVVGQKAARRPAVDALHAGAQELALRSLPKPSEEVVELCEGRLKTRLIQAHSSVQPRLEAGHPGLRWTGTACCSPRAGTQTRRC